MSKLWEFLKKYVVEKGEKGRLYTHTSLNGSGNFIGDTGTYLIPSKRINEFYRNCADHIASGGVYFLQTKTTDVIRFFVDIDSSEIIDTEQLKECVEAIRTQFSSWFGQPAKKCLVLRNSSCPNRKMHLHFHELLLELQDARDFIEVLQFNNSDKAWATALDFKYNGCRMIGSNKWVHKKSSDSSGYNYYGYPAVGKYIPNSGITVENLKLYEHAIWQEVDAVTPVLSFEERMPAELLQQRNKKLERPEFAMVYYSEEQISEIHALAVGYDPSVGDIRDVSDTGLITWWREEEGFCQQCRRDHDNDNTRYAFVRDRDVYFGCNKAQGENRYVFLGAVSTDPEVELLDEPEPEEEVTIVEKPDFTDPLVLFTAMNVAARKHSSEKGKKHRIRKKETNEAKLNGVQEKLRIGY